MPKPVKKLEGWVAVQESFLLSIFDGSIDAVIVFGILIALAIGFLLGMKAHRKPNDKRKNRRKK